MLEVEPDNGTRYEQETIINFNAAEKTAKLYTRDPAIIRQLLLCDEFEKTTRPVFSFFLQLLEEGKFTDSLAREYDLNGYVVIFTSNLQTEADYKKIIPPELQTRFDLVCEFNEPTIKDKEAYLQYLLQTAKTKVEGVDKLSSSSYKKLTNLSNYCSTSLRELKKEFNNYLLDELDCKIRMNGTPTPL